MTIALAALALNVVAGDVTDNAHSAGDLMTSSASQAERYFKAQALC